MNEVFGEENFVATIVWRKKFSPDARQDIDPTHDFVVVYAKSSRHLAEQDTFGIMPLSEKRKETFKNPDNDARGPWASVDMTGMTGRATKDQFFSITLPSGRDIAPPSGRSWGLAEATFEKLRADGRIWFGKDGDGVPRIKRYLSEATGQNSATWWSEEESGTTESARKTLLSIMDQPDAFDFPKPLELLARIVSLLNDPSAIVLDSFAGSGTTAHAIMDLNAKDGGNRRFILVQMAYDSKKNEEDKVNICQKVTVERVRRLMQGYKRAGNGNRENVPGLGGSFTYARLGPPLFGEYRDLGDKLPAFDELAKYIFYTETSQEFDAKAMDAKTGRIGKDRGTAYYLLYTPDAKESRSLDLAWLKQIAKSEECRKIVVYSEKLWVHRDDLAKWQKETKRTIRPMLVPFNLK
jgi:adenine-specific DNA-methyltransferase